MMAPCLRLRSANGWKGKTVVAERPMDNWTTPDITTNGSIYTANEFDTLDTDIQETGWSSSSSDNLGFLFNESEADSSIPSADAVLQCLDEVKRDFPNSQGKWIYIDHNIHSTESLVANDVPSEAWQDADYMDLFCSAYPFGPRNRQPEECYSMNAEQIYQVVEAVTPLLMDMSETPLHIADNAFCRPLPPDEIFCMVSAATPSLGSADTIKRMYYHALTDPTKFSRVNSAAVLSGREGSTAADEDWMLMLVCPMCVSFDCPGHAHGCCRKLLEKPQTCSSDCFLSSSIDEIFRPADVLLKASKKVVSMRQKAIELCKSESFFCRPLFDHWPCTFALDSGLSCSLVFQLQMHLKLLGNVLAPPRHWKAPVPCKLRKGTRNHTWKKLLNVVQRLRNNRKEDAEQERHPYRPCFCIGKCEKANCACAQYGFCEKYCFCSADCILRFPGCRCQTDCISNLCPCFKANRECDVDLCIACSGMKVVANNNNTTVNGCSYSRQQQQQQRDSSILTMSKLWTARCNNMQLQEGSKQRLLVSESNVHGLGVYAGEPLKKGDLVCEYTGEIVPRREADRRGIVYDYVSKSYLFTLNKEYDIDATRFGNEARFINHCSESKCSAEIKLVNGAHRIGIYAIKSIKVGEELFFNYRYSKEDEERYPHLV